MTGIEIPLLVIGTVFYVASFFIAEKLGPKELNKIGELSNREIRKVMERELQKVTADIESRVEEKADEALAASESSLDAQCNEKIKAIGEYSDTVIENINKSHNEVMFLYSMLNDKHAELTKFSTKLQELASTLTKHEEQISKYLAQKKSLDASGDTPAAGMPRILRPASPARSSGLVKTVKEAKPVPETVPAAPEPEEKPVKAKEEKEPKEKKQGREKKTKKAVPKQEKRVEDSWPDEDFSDMADSNHNAAILALHKEGKSAIDIARELLLGLGEVQLVIGLYEGNKKQ